MVFHYHNPRDINMSSDPLLELSGINKIYKMGQIDLQVLFDVSLHIYDGDFVSIIGPSGSGKTTLLNIIACLDRPSSGVYNFFGENVGLKSNDEMSAIRNLRIGFIFQSFNLIPRHTALENVIMPLHYSTKFKNSNFKNLGLECLEKVGLSERVNHYPNELSGGQQQQGSYCKKALVTNPEIILADEPTGNLDSKTSDDIMRLLKDLNMQGKTIITITHDNEVAEQASEIIRIKDGRVI
ncbi:macrolide export ATP-binding/permease protein MacB [bacterium]|nr:MAG: macrolide export ATP-binding/permease protein MacB [bacterium]